LRGKILPPILVIGENVDPEDGEVVVADGEKFGGGEDLNDDDDEDDEEIG